MEQSENYAGSVRTIRSSWNINEVTIDVIELEKREEDEKMKVSRAWVFHDDIFIILAEDKRLYTSVEVLIRLWIINVRFLPTNYLSVDTSVLLQLYYTAVVLNCRFPVLYCRVFTTLSTCPQSP